MRFWRQAARSAEFCDLGPGICREERTTGAIRQPLRWQVLFVAVLSAAAISAAAADAPSGRANVASSEGFTAVQFANPDPQAVLEAWTNPTAAGVQLQTDGRGRRDQPIYTFVIFRGCRTDAAGACTLTADFEVDDPAGKPYVQQKRVRSWVNKPPEPAPNFTLASGYMGLVVEHKDMPGPYTVRMTLTDQVSGITLHTEQTLNIAE